MSRVYTGVITDDMGRPIGSRFRDEGASRGRTTAHAVGMGTRGTVHGSLVTGRPANQQSNCSACGGWIAQDGNGKWGHVSPTDYRHKAVPR